MSISTKLRLVLLVIVAGALFGWLLLPMAQPKAIGWPITLVRHAQPLIMIAAAIVSALAVTLAGGLIGGKHKLALASLAAPLGLAVWAIYTSNMTIPAILQNTASERSSLFLSQIGDVVILAVVVFGCYIISSWWAQRSSEDTGSPKWLAQAKDLQQGPAGLAITCVASIILLLFIARAGTTIIQGIGMTCAVRTGQAVFATAAAFYVSSWLARQFFKVGLFWLLLAPPIVAIIAYSLAGGLQWSVTGNGDLVGPLVRSSAAFATILPIQYISVGSLAVMTGYWSTHNSDVIKSAAKMAAGV